MHTSTTSTPTLTTAARAAVKTERNGARVVEPFKSHPPLSDVRAAEPVSRRPGTSAHPAAEAHKGAVASRLWFEDTERLLCADGGTV